VPKRNVGYCPRDPAFNANARKGRRESGEACGHHDATSDHVNLRRSPHNDGVWIASDTMAQRPPNVSLHAEVRRVAEYGELPCHVEGIERNTTKGTIENDRESRQEAVACPLLKQGPAGAQQSARQPEETIQELLGIAHTVRVVQGACEVFQVADPNQHAVAIEREMRIVSTGLSTAVAASLVLFSLDTCGGYLRAGDVSSRRDTAVQCSMPQIHRYYGVVHVRWELPFPTRLHAKPFLCWEPTEGTALLLCLPRIGTVKWRRNSNLVDERQLLGVRFLEEPPGAIDPHSFRQSNELTTGAELFTTEILAGAQGGFDEAHAYTVANVFLSLRERSDFDNEAPVTRASAAVNNVLGVHGLLTADGWTRPIRQSLDTYATTSSLAIIPSNWPQLAAADLLKRIELLNFASEIGQGRTMTIGAGSPDDLLQQQFEDSAMALITEHCQRRFDLTAYQQLVLSAIRRLGRREYVGAVIDAQSAVEVCVEGMLRRALLATGRSEDQVDVHVKDLGLGRRVDHLDGLSQTKGVGKRFAPSQERQAWNHQLADLRHDIVHRGRREVSFEQARQGLAAGMTAIKALEDNWPEFQPAIRWDGDYLTAEHLRENAGKLYRLFDT
jgi:hypothetical protein